MFSTFFGARICNGCYFLNMPDILKTQLGNHCFFIGFQESSFKDTEGLIIGTRCRRPHPYRYIPELWIKVWIANLGPSLSPRGLREPWNDRYNPVSTTWPYFCCFVCSTNRTNAKALIDVMGAPVSTKS